MNYRSFGKDGWKISILGFGAMRLPATSTGTGVDVDLSIRLIRHAIDRGINYIDTAYIYHDGQSEPIVAQALAGGYRDSVRIASKSPGHLISTADDFDRILDEQIRRLDYTHIDYYLFHGIGTSGFDQIRQLHLIDRMEKAKADGRIRHIGFSFHDNSESFKTIIDGYSGWEFCQIQYNYMDINNQAGTAGLHYAAARGIPVVVMEPLLGGRLAHPPRDVAPMFTSSDFMSTPAAWALRWIWNHQEVTSLLSGMNSFEQIDENCTIAHASFPGSMSDGEQRTIAAIRSALNKRSIIPCTECNYCKPCPAGVEIPWNISQYNAGKVYDDPGAPRFVYKTFMKPQQRASACTACKSCESRCPQHIAISEWMEKIEQVLGAGASYPD